MQFHSSTAALLSAALFGTALAHGNITSPPSRLPGAAMAAACGSAAANAVRSDGTAPIENIPTTGAKASCNTFLCKGAQFADNKANVQTFALGDVVDFTAILPIPHEGPANVSIVDTKLNQIIGDPLLEFDTYADEALAVLPANNTAFSVTIPDDLNDQCTVAGECVLQWFWFGTAAQQTYESCVDFVIA